MAFAIHWHRSAMAVHASLLSWGPSHLPPHPIPLGCPSVLALNALLHALNLDWSSISHVVIYMSQYYSLKPSHPYLLPQSPKVCSLHPYLFCCLAYRVIVTIFLNSIYMHSIYMQTLYWCFSFWLTSLIFICILGACETRDSQIGSPLQRGQFLGSSPTVHYTGEDAVSVSLSIYH